MSGAIVGAGAGATLGTGIMPGLGTGLGAAAGGIAGAISDWMTNESNASAQRDLLDQQLRMYNLNRWDATHAAQIRAADLEAAGLSKTLAAGSAASPVSIPSMQAPKRELGIAGRGVATAADIIGALRGQEEIAKTKAERSYIEIQAEKALSEKHGIDIENDYKIGSMQDRLELVSNEVRRLKSTISNLDIDAVNKMLDTELKGYEKEKADLINKNLISQMNYDWGKDGAKKQELISKVLAVDLKKHDIEILKKFGLVSTWGSDFWLRMGAVVQQNMPSIPKMSGGAWKSEEETKKWYKEHEKEIERSNPWLKKYFEGE